MDELNQSVLFIKNEIEEVINTVFMPTEKKEFNQLLKKLNTNVSEIMMVFLENKDFLMKHIKV